MTTNYLTFELISRMEHEERLREAKRLQLIDEVSRFAPQGATNWLGSLRTFFSRLGAANRYPAPATKTANMELSTSSAASFSSNRLMTEDEWLMLFRMVKNRRLSAEQAAQLLIALS